MAAVRCQTDEANLYVALKDVAEAVLGVKDTKKYVTMLDTNPKAVANRLRHCIYS